MDGLKADGLLSTNAFSQTIQFTYFDLGAFAIEDQKPMLCVVCGFN